MRDQFLEGDVLLVTVLWKLLKPRLLNAMLLQQRKHILQSNAPINKETKRKAVMKIGMKEKHETSTGKARQIRKPDSILFLNYCFVFFVKEPRAVLILRVSPVLLIFISLKKSLMQ